MIRYVASFPDRLSDVARRTIRAQLEEVANSQRLRDIVLDSGGTLVRMMPDRPRRAFLSRARARVR